MPQINEADVLTAAQRITLRNQISSRLKAREQAVTQAQQQIQTNQQANTHDTASLQALTEEVQQRLVALQAGEPYTGAVAKVQ